MISRLIRAFRHHPIGELPGLIFKNICYAWEHRNDPKRISDFDSAYQVETDNIRETGSLDIDSPNIKHAVRYEPSPTDTVKSILTQLNLEWPQFTFVDFGAGKGRVLLLAAELPFQKIIGVEFSPELAEQANKNIINYRGPASVDDRLSCQCLDAVDFAVPKQPLICYFYNPFGDAVLEKVLSNIMSSYAEFERDIYIIYVHPVHRAVIEQKKQIFTTILETSDAIVYRINQTKSNLPGK